MTELVVTLWALGGIGTAMALYSMVETSHEEMTASKNAIMVRTMVISALWPALVLLFLIMALLPDHGEGLRHWIMNGNA
jgi:hypothetical protein